MSDLPKPLGFRLPPSQRVTNEQLHERLCSVEGDVRKHGLLIAEMKGSVDTLLEFAIEDRKGRATTHALTVQEQGATERVRLTTRAKVIVTLMTTLGGVLGAGIAAAMSGCN